MHKKDKRVSLGNSSIFQSTHARFNGQVDICDLLGLEVDAREVVLRALLARDEVSAIAAVGLQRRALCNQQSPAVSELQTEMSSASSKSLREWRRRGPRRPKSG